MSDPLSDAFSSLGPDGAQRARMERHVLQGLDARPPSLFREWWGLVFARPVANVAWMGAAACGVLTLTPLWALLAALALPAAAPGALQTQRSHAALEGQFPPSLDWAVR